MFIRGRLTKPVVQTYPDVDGVRIRIDDENDLPFWLEICLSREEIESMLAHCCRSEKIGFGEYGLVKDE
jgi:hypothetical protein